MSEELSPWRPNAPCITNHAPLTGMWSVLVFLVNRCTLKPDDLHDEAFAFQAQLDIHSDRPFMSAALAAGSAA